MQAMRRASAGEKVCDSVLRELCLYDNFLFRMVFTRREGKGMTLEPRWIDIDDFNNKDPEKLFTGEVGFYNGVSPHIYTTLWMSGRVIANAGKTIYAETKREAKPFIVVSSTYYNDIDKTGI